jgi:5-methyltetrahydrofolate corrinoid/iron sulfur protein methyltransferase
MKISKFISVGENIHCTRIFKVGGAFCKPLADGTHAIVYRTASGERQLPVPEIFTARADWAAGKVKHCAVAIWQGVYGEGAARSAGVDYLQNLARQQAAAGATYLDINVDEFSTDVAERVRLMQWSVETIQHAVSIPMSIDSSNLEILKAGLDACDRGRGRPMVNSVSLERADAVAVAAAAEAVVIASAAGAEGLPNAVEERLANMTAIYERLAKAGFAMEAIHFDPLVFPISTDGQNGVRFLDAVKAVRARYGAEIHVVAGLSNISFGMPCRKLINQVFTWLACEAGADGGIVDPMQINLKVLNGLDPVSEPFRLARNLLLGEDEYGMEFIAASREGQLE